VIYSLDLKHSVGEVLQPLWRLGLGDNHVVVSARVDVELGVLLRKSLLGRHRGRVRHLVVVVVSLRYRFSVTCRHIAVAIPIS
jgi:hypothetical protein